MTPPSTNAVLKDRQARELICDLCRKFYDLGWASGTGGGISVRSGDKIFMAPSGVQKERLHPEDIFVLDLKGDVLESPDPLPPGTELVIPGVPTGSAEDAEGS